MQTIRIYNRRPSLVVLPPVRGGAGRSPSIKLVPGANEVPKHQWDVAIQSAAVQGFVKGRILSTDARDMPDMHEMPRLSKSDIPADVPVVAKEGVEFGAGFQTASPASEKANKALAAEVAALKKQLAAAQTMPAPAPEPGPVMETLSVPDIASMRVADARDLILSSKDESLLNIWVKQDKRKTVQRELKAQLKRVKKVG